MRDIGLQGGGGAMVLGPNPLWDILLRISRKEFSQHSPLPLQSRPPPFFSFSTPLMSEGGGC